MAQTNTTDTSPGFIGPLTAARHLFYIVGPNETSFPTVETVPRFVEQVVPYFILMLVTEFCLLHLKGEGSKIPLSDSLGSLSAGIFSRLPLLLSRSAELSAYVWVYENFRLFEASWDSPLSWLLALIGVDLGYYWAHRMAHEINLFWSGHQLHHSSQRYNLTTALRQSLLQPYFSCIFYLPMALALPPSLFLAHSQFNLIYQFWIHTEMIDKLPWPIEFVMSTPSHHRVHHGRNPYCIDKNYGGTFIIFDRIFGTFEAEREDERPVYGLIHPVQTLDPLELQVFHLRYVLQLCWRQRSLPQALKAAFFGPGWQAGTPRLGDGRHPPVEQPVRFFQPQAPRTAVCYAFVHLAVCVLAYGGMAALRASMSFCSLLASCCLVVLALSSIARVVESFGRAALGWEFLRCILTASLCLLLPSLSSSVAPQAVWLFAAAFFAVSAVFCLVWRSRLRHDGKSD